MISRIDKLYTEIAQSCTNHTTAIVANSTLQTLQLPNKIARK